MFSDLAPYPAYVPGTPWSPTLPEHWQLRRGKALFVRRVRPVRDSDGVVTCFRDGVVTLRSLRRTTGFTEALQEIGYQGVRAGDLVIHAMDAFAGAVGVSDSDGKCSPVYAVCRPRDEAEPHYYAALVREMARSGWIMALSRGIRERSTDFRFESFASALLPAPPADEQAAIVKYLAHAHHRIDRAIAAKRKLIALLEEQKQAIITQAVTRGLDPTAPLKESGIPWLGRVPAHWEVAELKHVLRGLIDCEHKTAPYSRQGVHRVVRTTAVRRGRLNWAGTYPTSRDAYTEWTRRGKPEAGDVIFTREAPAGEACVVPANAEVCLGQRTVLMRVDRTLANPYFLVHQIYAGAPREQIRVATQGSTVGHFNMDDIGWMRVLVPPLAEQAAIVRRLDAEVDGTDRAAERVVTEIDLLREFRARLTSDVVTGQVDIRHIAATLPDLDLAGVTADVSAFDEDLLDDAAEFFEDVDA